MCLILNLIGEDVLLLLLSALHQHINDCTCERDTSEDNQKGELVSGESESESRLQTRL